MPDYIPRPDPEFDIWALNLATKASDPAIAAVLGLNAGQLSDLSGAKDNWHDSFGNFKTVEAQFHGATDTKTGYRNDFENLVRPLIAQWQENPAVTDALRNDLRIPVRSTSRTPAPVPSTRPALEADTSQRLRIVLNFRDENALHKAKPDGVRGCQIWEKIGDPAPVDLTGMTYLATDTRTPYLVIFDAADAGKIAHFIARWENTRGETGPLSEVLSVVVPGLWGGARREARQEREAGRWASGPSVTDGSETRRTLSERSSNFR